MKRKRFRRYQSPKKGYPNNKCGKVPGNVMEKDNTKLEFERTFTNDELKKTSFRYLIWNRNDNTWYITGDVTSTPFPTWAIVAIVCVIGILLAGVAFGVCKCGGYCCFKFVEEEPLALEKVNIVKPDSPESPENDKAEDNKVAGVEAEN